ncbi:hypothetical protein SDC9_137515 [bioreactor metagenome]|uniref:Uncharacterized protein n=1 Tax=bioreactor metagenome TaxID=1076179 RepID=A0A645DLR8_9ZZZZ
MAVSAVYYDISGFEMRDELFNKIVNGLSGLDHNHDFPRLCKVFTKLFDRICSDYVLAFCAAFDEISDFFRCAVIYRDRKALRFHIHYEVFAHYRESNESDISFFHIL